GRPRPRAARRGRAVALNKRPFRRGPGRAPVFRKKSPTGFFETRLGWRPGTAPSVVRPRLTPGPLTFWGARARSREGPNVLSCAHDRKDRAGMGRVNERPGGGAGGLGGRYPRLHLGGTRHFAIGLTGVGS